MDLIYMNESREDIGVLQDYGLDLAFGADENNFECQIQTSNHCCQKNYLIYIEGTEYGGIIDSIGINTESNTITYSGRTWHGVLSSKVILPLTEGESADGVVLGDTVGRYLEVTGDAYDCMWFILNRCGLASLFTVPSEPLGITIESFRFDRYTDGYKGLQKMLASIGMLLKFTFADGMVLLSAVAKRDFSYDEEFDSDLIDFDLVKKENRVNHLICLGSGELENRQVIHLYADEKGNISETQTFFGIDEYVDVYDYSNVETVEELIEEGKQRLKELADADEVNVDFDVAEDVYNIGDVVGAVDNITNTFISTAITKKIISIRNDSITVSLETAEPSTRINDIKLTANNASMVAAAARTTARTATATATNAKEVAVQAQALAVQAQALAEKGVTNSELLDFVYPIGSIYMSVNSTNPGSFIGGTWSRIQDRFLLAAGSSYSAGSTGGAATHTLTVDEMPSHTHTYSRKYAAEDTATTAVAKGATSSQTTVTETSDATGGGKAHNNMPPYLAVYVWERTK